MSAPAVFLDRDGTLIEDIGYLTRLDQIAYYPWTIDAVRALNRAGFRVAVVTNQAGVARGYMTAAAVEAVHRQMTSVFEANGARIDAYYYCPHHPDGSVEDYAVRCECRKPGPELVRRAARDLDLDPAKSFVVGDKWIDVGLARAVGARGILVRTGYGADEEAHPRAGFEADAVVDNLAAAVSWILRS